jgi:hypothetical protein
MFFDKPKENKENKDWKSEVPVVACAKNNQLPLVKCPDKQKSSKNKLPEPNESFEEEEVYDTYNCCYYTVRKPKHKILTDSENIVYDPY